MAKPKIKGYPVCSHCQSKNVNLEAIATWDQRKQQWALSDVYEKSSWCSDCEEDCALEWVND